MIISRLSGGLGNQMFQIAAAFALKFKFKQDIFLDTSFFQVNRLHNGYELERVFGINLSEASEHQKRSLLSFRTNKYLRVLADNLGTNFLNPSTVYKEYALSFDSQFMNRSNSLYLMGYFQSPKYFLEYETEIKNLFSFNLDYIAYQEQHKLLREDCTLISLHVRRGDYLSPNNAKVYATCSVNYYNKAIEFFHNNFENPFFMVFTDDPLWCKSNLNLENKSQFTNNAGQASYLDMYLMSKCQHHIIANSTFSWWGAWLGENSEKVVLCPDKWFVSEEMQSQIEDIYVRNWKRLQNV